MVLAVVDQHNILEVRRRCLYRARPSETHDAYGARAVEELVHDYRITSVVAEPDRQPFRWAKETDLPTTPLPLIEAKQVLLPDTVQATHVDLCEHLLEQHPKLQRLVTILPGKPGLATSERWKTVTLLAVALGLAAHLPPPT